LDEDLGAAINRALLADRKACAAEAAHYEWDQCTDAFLAGLAMLPGEQPVLDSCREPAWPGLAASC
jgi:hypothetical protein